MEKYWLYSFRHSFAYDVWVRELSPIQVLTVILRRLEKRANVLERLTMTDYRVAVGELRHFANMVRQAREYLRWKAPTRRN